MRGCCKRNSEHKRGLVDWPLLFYSSDVKFFHRDKQRSLSQRHLQATDFGPAFFMQSGMWSIPSCPLRSCLINIYQSRVATRDQYISVPVTQTNTQAHSLLRHQNAWASWAPFSQDLTNILPHCSFTLSSLMQMIRTVKFWSLLITWKRRFLGVSWKEKAL